MRSGHQNPKPDQPHDDESCAVAWHLLRRAHDRIADRLTAELNLNCQLSINDFDTLLYLTLNRGLEVRLTDLTSAVALSQPALSRLVGRLAERGLVDRTADSRDARAVLISLTETGAELAERAFATHSAAVETELTGRMAAAEQALLLAMLSRIGSPD